MKKVYQPLNMIKNGRYAVLYGKLAPELQQQVLARMASHSFFLGVKTCFMLPGEVPAGAWR